MEVALALQPVIEQLQTEFPDTLSSQRGMGWRK